MESRWHRAAPVVLALVGAVLAGCNDAPPEMLEQAEADALAMQAPARLAEALRDPPAAGLAASDGAIKVTRPTAAPTGDARDITYRVTWGRDDVVRVVFHVAASSAPETEASPQPFTIHCLPDMDLVGTGAGTAQARKGEGPEDPCLTDDGWPTLLTADPNTAQLSRPPDLEGLTFGSAQPTPDGGARVVYQGPGRNYTAALDAQGRIASLAYKHDLPDNRGTYRFHYGSAEDLQVPEAERRIPAEVAFNVTFNGQDPHNPPPYPDKYEPCSENRGVLRWHVMDIYQDVPRSEFELRVWRNERPFMIAASFSLEDPEGQDAGLSYRYIDNDSDGRLSEGDGVEVAWDPIEGYACDIDYQPSVWDEWAESYLRTAGPPE